MTEATETTQAEQQTTKKPARPKFKVAMNDGREVEFPEGTKALKEILKGEGESGDPISIRFDFAHGATFVALLSDLPPAILAQAAAHGLSQKLGDSYASKKLSSEDAVEAVQKIWEALKNGDWSIRSSEVGESMAGTGVLTAALSRVYNAPVDQVKEILKGMSAKEKQSLRIDPSISAEIQAIERERLMRSGGVDVEALKQRFAMG